MKKFFVTRVTTVIRTYLSEGQDRVDAHNRLRARARARPLYKSEDERYAVAEVPARSRHAAR